MIKVRTEIEIEAPANIVWQILTDFERYDEWNPFIRLIDGRLKVGENRSRFFMVRIIKALWSASLVALFLMMVILIT